MPIIGGQSSSVWRTRRGVVSDSATDTILQLALNNFRTVVLHASFYNDANDKTHKFSLNISREGTDLRDTVTNKITNVTGFLVNVNQIGADMVVSVNNTSGFDLTWKTTQIID